MKTAYILRALGFAVTLALPGLPANAGAWKRTGEGYAIQVSAFDLAQPGDRQAILRDVEYLAKKLCVAQTSRTRVGECQKQMVKSAIAQAAPALRDAVQLAMTERKGVQYAMR
jgi:UrcA family protein